MHIRLYNTTVFLLMGIYLSFLRFLKILIYLKVVHINFESRVLYSVLPLQVEMSHLYVLGNMDKWTHYRIYLIVHHQHIEQYNSLRGKQPKKVFRENILVSKQENSYQRSMDQK